MKRTNVILALALLTLLACNRSTVIRKSISYKGEMMRIEVYKKIDGRKIQDFEKDYNVAGMDKVQREALAQAVMDSLEVQQETGR